MARFDKPAFDVTTAIAPPLPKTDTAMAAASRAAGAELQRRLKYQALQCMLRAIETLEAVPEGDWRGRLEAVERLGREAEAEDR
ncbi:MAG: hypothetical protein B7Z44_15275 [Caulobacter sp. 12-67-6]|mgnify:CR=1 FL=1|nr:MAG: hypothetical protein B7Z44_15275 [Caulobacter sp. 12-67-6]OYX71024.1 MAG: hypothetical protein B7Y81_10065 [Caulobacter sp. 32-67-35]OZA75573.1 MAG: hypothetical protein B7X77_07150 [Caulobacter sp. 39-67-4]HQR90525.1 hypothetical protein [Caulobacter sp.]